MCTVCAMDALAMRARIDSHHFCRANTYACAASVALIRQDLPGHGIGVVSESFHDRPAWTPWHTDAAFSFSRVNRHFERSMRAIPITCRFFSSRDNCRITLVGQALPQRLQSWRQ
jgi:hypothetical protein